MPRVLQPYHRQIIIRRRSDNRGANDLAAGETHRYLLRSTHHMIVRHDMPGAIPYDASPALLADALAFDEATRPSARGALA